MIKGTYGRIVMAGLIAAAIPAAAGAASDPAVLRIRSIDVEGGAATLYVTPQGHSLLIDTGWPSGMGGARPAPGAPPPPPTPSSAERIAAVAKSLGVTRIDYLLLTHYHVDHAGGLTDLLATMPVGTFIDHGENREPPRDGATPAQLATASATLYTNYSAALAGHAHRVLKPGETLKIDALTLTAVDADRQIVTAPMMGGGKPGVGCDKAVTGLGLGGEENPRSLGIVASWGKARVMALGDTTWDVENQLVCPRDMIGPVDLMFIDNHGTANSNSPPLIDTVHSKVVVLNNGPIKGADGEVLDRLKASTATPDVWQVHFATRSPDKNTAPERIANIEGEADLMRPLEIAVRTSGAITLTNPRTGFTKTYAK